MFKSGRWRSERNKVRVVFKLQFHAAKVPSVGDDALTLSVVPADAGKPSAKSDKSAVRDGSCLWENPVYETVKFNVDMKSGKFHRKIYNFVVATGSSKSGVVGEASLDFSKYVDSNDVTLVSLPLKSSKAEAVLNVSIQRMQDSDDQRLAETEGSIKSNQKDHSLRSQLSNEDIDETAKSNSDVILYPLAKGSSGSDLTVSSSGSSSGVEIPWQPDVKSNRFARGLNAVNKTAVHDESCRSQWEWLGNSILEASTEDSLSTPRENFMTLNLEEPPDIVVEKLKSEIASLSRQMEMSELELQNLRKQIVKESKRGQELFREVVLLKEERDSLWLDSEKLKLLERSTDGVKGGFEAIEYKATVEELRQELNHEKELNSNLRIQLRKTQESNSELILAVQDLDEMLEQRNQDLVNLKNGSSEKQIDDSLHRLASGIHLDNENDDKEQEIVGLHGELEMYKRDKEELEMQMEQLALDYEIMKQENHEMVNKLQQIRLREQLKIQYECSSSCVATQELESQIEKLEEKLRSQIKESEAASARIKDLEAHVKILEDEFDKQAQGLKADLEDAISRKVEQEQRALVAEEALRKTRIHNANTAERLQEEFRRLSAQMASTFEANEKLATKAIAEANELRLQKAYLEEVIKRVSEENQLIKSQNDIRLEQLAVQVSMLTSETRKLHSELDDKEQQLQDQERDAEEAKLLLSEEISMLKKENETQFAEIRCLSEEMEVTENLKNELGKMRAHMKEMEAQESGKILELGDKIMQLKTGSEKSQKELNKVLHLMEEKESLAADLRAELDSLHSQNEELKSSISETKLEKENLTKQALQLKGELKKKEDTLISMEKKMKENIGRGASSDAAKVSPKSSSRSSKEVANLKDRIKLLQGDIKSKETALEMSNKAYLEKEKHLLCKIQELEGRVDLLSHNSIHYSENPVDKDLSSEEARNGHQGSNPADRTHEALEEEEHSTSGLRDDEMSQLREKSKTMEAELKEMQERYSELSLKFAEVEGERQQLVMRVRNLKNAHKASAA